MGRPFTYNDENFTVIGNILFVHYHLRASAATSGPTWRDEPTPVPQGIVDRLAFDHVLGSLTSRGAFVGDSSSPLINRIKNGHISIYSSGEIIKGSILTATYYLKDI